MFTGADDAFAIGLTAFDRQKNQLSQSWLDEALQLLDHGVYFHGKKPSRFEILDHLAWLEYLVNFHFVLFLLFLAYAFIYKTFFWKLDKVIEN